MSSSEHVPVVNWHTAVYQNEFHRPHVQMGKEKEKAISLLTPHSAFGRTVILIGSGFSPCLRLEAAPIWGGEHQVRAPRERSTPSSLWSPVQTDDC